MCIRDRNVRDTIKDAFFNKHRWASVQMLLNTFQIELLLRKRVAPDPVSSFCKEKVSSSERHMWAHVKAAAAKKFIFYWRHLLRHVETHCQSIAFGSNHSSSTFDFCNTSSVKRHGTEIASKNMTPVQKKRVINVALAAAGTTLFRSTTLKDKLRQALALPGGEGQGRGKPSPQGYKIKGILHDYGIGTIYTPHDP